MTIDDVEQGFSTLTINTEGNEQKAEALSLLVAESRKNEETRERLAQPRTLQYLVDIVATSVHDDLETTILALRCIGNACVTGAGREAITDIGFSWANICLSQGDRSAQLVTAKALNNACYDYEPAQRACYRERIHFALLRVCTNLATSDTPDATLVTDLLLEITSQKASDKDAPREQVPANVLSKLASLPTSYNDKSSEDFATAIEVVLTFLRDPVIQSQIVECRLVHQVWDLLAMVEGRVHHLQSSSIPEEPSEDERLLAPLATSIIWCLSDIASDPGFAKQYGAEDDFLRSLVELIGSRPAFDGQTVSVAGDNCEAANNSMRMLIAACQILGNYLWATKAEAATFLVESKNLHTALFDVVAKNDDAELLHSAAGMLIQLTRPSAELRATIGSGAGAEIAMFRLCESGTPNLKEDGLKLLRALGTECPANQERFAQLAKDTMASVASAPATETQSSMPRLEDAN